jgi:hypothetical protein
VPGRRLTRAVVAACWIVFVLVTVLLPAAIVTLCGSEDSLVKRTVTAPAFTVASRLSKASFPPGSAASCSTLVEAGAGDDAAPAGRACRSSPSSPAVITAAVIVTATSAPLAAMMARAPTADPGKSGRRIPAIAMSRAQATSAQPAT